VHSQEEYQRAVEHLYQHPEERARLGRAAAEHARAHFGAENAARLLNPLYERLRHRPKRQRLWGCRPDSPLLEQPLALMDVVETPDSVSGARMFVESLGDTGRDFLTSLVSLDLPALWVAEERISQASTLVRSVGSGGILHYRNAFPDDGFLRLWSGLVLQQEGSSPKRSWSWAKPSISAATIGVSAGTSPEPLRRPVNPLWPRKRREPCSKLCLTSRPRRNCFRPPPATFPAPANRHGRRRISSSKPRSISIKGI